MLLLLHECCRGFQAGVPRIIVICLVTARRRCIIVSYDIDHCFELASISRSFQRLPVRTRTEMLTPESRNLLKPLFREFPLNHGHQIAGGVLSAADRQSGLTTGRNPSSSERYHGISLSPPRVGSAEVPRNIQRWLEREEHNVPVRPSESYPHGQETTICR